MKIGIIIPYYENQMVMRDRLKWLLEVLLYQKDYKTEIVVVDDGSNATWLDKYHKIKVIHSKKNVGVSGARNIGLEYIINKVSYVGFLDADDSVSADYINEAYKCMLDGYDFIDSRFVQEGLEIFGTQEGNKRQKEIIRGGVAGCFFKTSVIGDTRFNEKLQIGEDTTFVRDIIDLSKHKKAVSMGTYIYNRGINTDSLTMRHARGEITEVYEQDFLTKKYYENMDSMQGKGEIMSFTFKELGENGISINHCFDFADKMGLEVNMSLPEMVEFKYIKNKGE
jgi:glycosyltransferase involved in cell wall biosynthesis